MFMFPDLSLQDRFYVTQTSATTPSEHISLPFSSLFPAVQPDVIISFDLELSLLARNTVCYDLKLKELSNKTTLVLSNTRELDRVPSTK